MAAIKSIGDIAKKWARVTPQRTEEYAEGIQSPRTSWAAATAAAAERYNSGLQESIKAGRFEKGVKAAGDAAWQQKALAKGPGRFAEGVSMSAPDYESGFAPYADTIRNTVLPPRFAAGDPRNIERTKAIAMALRKKKTG